MVNRCYGLDCTKKIGIHSYGEQHYYLLKIEGGWRCICIYPLTTREYEEEKK